MALIGGLLGDYLAYDAAKDAADKESDRIKRTAADNAKISRYDATVAEADANAIVEQTVDQFVLHAEKSEALMARQRVAYAVSGVALSKGTPMDVMADTAGKVYLDGQKILHAGKTAAERKRSLAKRYNMLADAGLRDASAHASAVRDAGTDQANLYLLHGIGTAADIVYNIGSEQDWWT